jgi:hypothetical protein
VPIAVKYLFDFLDELAEKHGIEDPETLHIWKTNRCLFLLAPAPVPLCRSSIEYQDQDIPRAGQEVQDRNLGFAASTLGVCIPRSMDS